MFPKRFKRIVDRISVVADDLGVAWMLIGAAPIAMWGEPRSSKDVDVILALDTSNQDLVHEQMLTHGFQAAGPLKELPNGNLYMRTYILGVLEVDVFYSDTEWQRETVQRRVPVRAHGDDVWVAAPEDSIIYKLLAFRGKDLDDIESVVREQYDLLAWRYLFDAAGELGLRNALFEAVENVRLAEGITGPLPWES